MDKINSINANTTSSNTDRIKQLAEQYDFDKFDTDGDGKLNETEQENLKQIFNTVDFDVDDEGYIDVSAFEDALEEYK